MKPGHTPIRNTVCAVIVTYNPDEGFAERVETIIKQVRWTVIVDNASSQAEHLLDLEVPLIRNEHNRGIAAALNQGMLWALEQEASWVIAFDQDSCLTGDLIEAFDQVLLRIDQPERVAVLGANWVERWGKTTLLPEGIPWKEVEAVITSGSLLSLQAFAQIGFFREDFFIDLVDFEYCLRARAIGYKIFIGGLPLMEHSIGNPTRRFGTNHAPARRYYMTRNLIAMIRGYWRSDRAWLRRHSWKHLKHVLAMLLFESNRRQKLQAVWRGFIDGLRGKMGPFSENAKPDDPQKSY